MTNSQNSVSQQFHHATHGYTLSTPVVPMGDPAPVVPVAPATIVPVVPVVPFATFVPHPHQLAALSWMGQREESSALYVRGGILADEMGLGKTWEAILLLLNQVVADTLLLVPSVLQPQWEEALRQSGIPHRVLCAPTKKDGSRWREVPGPRPFRVSLSTYDRAVGNIDLLKIAPFDRLVCDEGHVLRNGYDTKRFRTLLEIVAPRRWILSGTPVQNNRADFQNLLKFLQMESELRLRTPAATIAATVLLRRTVGEVRSAVPTMPTEKPLHTVHPVVFPGGGEEERVFGSLVGKFEHALETGAKMAIILELYLRIRQFASHPLIYVEAMKRKFKKGYARETWTDSASKMGAFETLVGEMEAKPTIVFTSFKLEMELARAALERAGYAAWSIGGGMSDAQREQVTRESKAAVEGGNRKIAIVVQIQAGGAGLNLQHCSRVFFLSSHWNPAVVDQAIARAYRMGQTERVEVHHMLLADDADKNLDRYMVELHGLKRHVATDIHPGLFCDSAVVVDEVLEELDAAFEVGDPL